MVGWRGRRPLRRNLPVGLELLGFGGLSWSECVRQMRGAKPAQQSEGGLRSGQAVSNRS